MHGRKRRLSVDQIFRFGAAADSAEAGFVELRLDGLVPVLQLRVEPALPGFLRVVGAISVAAFGGPAPDAAETKI